MRKKLGKRLVLTAETLRNLSDAEGRGAGVIAKAVTDGCDTEDNTCYWGCSFASCPEGGCDGGTRPHQG